VTRRTLLALALAVTLDAAAAGGGQAVGESSSDGSFRFEWEITSSRKGSRLDAYLYNLTLRPVQNVQVLVEELDNAGNPVRRSITQVWGGVQAGDRTFFRVSGVKPGARYRLSVLNYDLQPVGGGG
jgi:hypothetical protein